MKEEIWKDIPNYSGYQVSNLGRIRTHNKITHTNKHGDRHWKDKILKPKEKKPKAHSKHQGKDGKGYAVDLWKDGKPKTLLVARLVAFTFYEKDINDHKLTVNHIDGNRLNNNLNNLELISLADNIRHGFETGLYDECCKKIILINKITQEEKQFRSLKSASLYMGKNKGYLSLQLGREKKENDEFYWKIVNK